MKINKLIAKGLSIGLLLNSVSILSYASTEIPNRYQTLEGEYITIDDATEGNLVEIEIFGNTVQNPNNLKDIQSVGDLYVDKNGNPILDSQGREQYKIDILSFNTNQWDGKMTNTKTTDYIKVYNGQFSSNAYDCYITEYDYNFNVVTPRYLTGGVSNTMYKLKSNDCKYIKIESNLFNPSDRYYVEGGLLLSSFDIIKMGQVPTCYFKENKTTILLPTQLQKVENIADRLYWDNKKGRYIIEKNIMVKTYNDLAGLDVGIAFSRDNTYCYRPIGFLDSKDILVRNNINNFSNIQYTNAIYKDEECFGYDTNGSPITFRISKDKIGSTQSKEDLFYFFESINFKVLYAPTVPQLIETNITSKLKIPTYDKKTHIYVNSENGINPTLKATIDRLPQIAKEAVAQAESDSTNDNIYLARIYVNMLPESSYKDQLQNQLSDIFSSDMVLDMKTATSNLDVYIKSENALSISLDTNQISFNDFSGVEDMENINAVNIAISSTLPYQINAYLPSEIQNADKSAIMDKRILQLKENSQSDYQYFQNINEKMVLKDNCISGNDIEHGLDIMLKGGIFHKKDVYKATIKLEAEQK